MKHLCVQIFRSKSVVRVSRGYKRGIGMDQYDSVSIRHFLWAYNNVGTLTYPHTPTQISFSLEPRFYCASQHLKSP